MTLTYPAAAPVHSATEPVLTVNALLQAPKVIQKRIVTEQTQFLSDLLFRPDTTGPSGAVLYGKAEKADQYPSRGDVQQVEPGAEFPMVDIDEGGMDVAVAQKFGAGYIVTDEARDRNQLSVIQKGNLKVRNAMLRQDAYRCFAAFENAVPTVNASAAWTTFASWKQDIVRNRAAIVGLGLGYRPDTVILHPNTIAELELLTELQTYAPREDVNRNPLFNPSIAGVFRMNYVENEFMAEDEAILLQTGMTGLNATEKAYGVTVVPEGTRERSVVIASKRSVPVIDEPESALVIKGIK